MNKMNVWYGSNENKWLSNLVYRPFVYEGKHYVTVEMCYQTWKSGEFDRSIYNKPWLEGLKIPGKKGTKTENDWNIKFMAKIMVLSFFNNPDQLERLRNLGDVEFTHTQDRGVWRKMFPRILKMIKDEI